jgi:NAD(P)H dehydrogenase (quinone)
LLKIVTTVSSKHILIIQGQPGPESYTTPLAEAYQRGARAAGARVDTLHSPTLLTSPWMAREKIRNADHLVWVLWWGSVPTLLHTCHDRPAATDAALAIQENSLTRDALTDGKTARIICTMEPAAWQHWQQYWQSGTFLMKKTVQDFCGIQPVGISAIGPLHRSSAAYREKWLKKIEVLGTEMR